MTVLFLFQTTLPTCQSESEMDNLVRLQSRLFQMSGADFTRLTRCYQPCVKDEVEVIRNTNLKYPYFQDGANSFVVVLVSTSMIEIRYYWYCITMLATDSVC